MERDAPADGRMALRPFWRIVQEQTRRDRDTVRFLVETEARFYVETYEFLRSLGFRGVIGASNWRTADDRYLGPLEKMVATTGDFVDRHGYFGVEREGDRAGWSLRTGQTYADRSALRFDGASAGSPRDFENPLMDVRYSGKPSMLSEVSWERPNRFRFEAPIVLAAYGALQQVGAIVHFRIESERWATRIRGIATPWPLTTPGQLGQFPAAALIFRRGLVSPGAVVAQVTLGREELLELRGTPLPHGASLADAERVQVVAGGLLAPGQRLDPLLHLAGRVDVEFTEGLSRAEAFPASGLIDPVRGRVRSTTHELELDYHAGLLVIDAPQAQGAVGNLRSRSPVETTDLRISSPMDTLAIVAVALDGKPIGGVGSYSSSGDVRRAGDGLRLGGRWGRPAQAARARVGPLGGEGDPGLGRLLATRRRPAPCHDPGPGRAAAEFRRQRPAHRPAPVGIPLPRRALISRGPGCRVRRSPTTPRTDSKSVCCDPCSRRAARGRPG